MSDAQTQEHDAQVALEKARSAGIARLSIPTPFQVGRVNAYLIQDRPLTLIDSGPNSAKALDELEQQLAALGYRVEDLELLVISHQHIDHFGLASVLQRRSGAQVAALKGLDHYLRNFREQAELDDLFAQKTMMRHGITAEVVSALRSVSASFRGWGATVDVTRALSDGEELQLAGRTLRVLHRPGHSPSDTVFWDEERSILFAADHLLMHISSNPLIARPLGIQGDYDGPRPRSLISYLDSLRQTREMNIDLVLPGHGPPITDHVGLIDKRMVMHQRRAQRILDLITEQPRSAHQIAQEMWGNIAVTQAYLTLSEVLGHVDLLLADGRVREQERDGVIELHAAG